MGRRPKVLMACLEYWASPFQLAGQHLARAFVRAGWDVAYISVPISPLHVAGGWTRSLRSRARTYTSGGSARSGLWAYVPGALLTPRNSPLLNGSWLLRNWWRLSVPNVVRLVKSRGFGEVDLLYIDAAVQGFWLEAVHHRRSVLRVADRLDGFGHISPAQIAAEREIAASVDLVAHAARSLEDHVQAMGARRTAYIPNGVDYGGLQALDASPADDIASIPSPRAVYVGAMNAWFDFETVNCVAAAMPDVSFVFIGGERPDTRLVVRPNVYQLGQRSWTKLARYLRHVDVGLIPFDVERRPALVNGIHPLKLYEYLAFGLPVVATHWEEIARLSSPAVLCRTVDDYVAAIRDALVEPSDTSAAVRFAAAASWDSRVRQLLDACDLP